MGERSNGSNGNGKSSSYPIGRHKVLRRRSLGTVIIPDESINEIRKGRRPGHNTPSASATSAAAADVFFEHPMGRNKKDLRDSLPRRHSLGNQQ